MARFSAALVLLALGACASGPPVPDSVRVAANAICTARGFAPGSLEHGACEAEEMRRQGYVTVPGRRDD